MMQLSLLLPLHAEPELPLAVCGPQAAWCEAPPSRPGRGCGAPERPHRSGVAARSGRTAAPQALRNSQGQ